MKKKMPFFIMFFLMISCKCFVDNKSIKDSNSLKSDVFFDYSWKDTLESKKNEMKKAWSDRFIPDMYFTGILSDPKYNKILNMPMISDDRNKYNITPYEVFEIKYNEFISWDTNIKVDEMLILSKSRARGFISYNNVLILDASLRYNNNEWKVVSEGPFNKNLADTINHISLEKEAAIFFVYVATNDNVKPYEKEFLVYINDKTLFNLDNNGKSESFENILKKFKNDLVSGKNW